VNFDEKSFRANDEANMNVLDREFCRDVIKTFERRQKQIAPSDQGRFLRNAASSQSSATSLSAVFTRVVNDEMQVTR